MKKLESLRSLAWVLRDLVRDYRVGATSQEVQRLLAMQYRASLLPLSFEDVGFRKFSQFDEDGILLYIFSKIGAKSRRVLEMCAGIGRECMATNLIVNHGWEGLLFEGDAKNVASALNFFRNNNDSFSIPPKVVQAWLTAETLNEAVRSNGFEGDIDLFSLDVDGNDYWFWKALDVVSPRVCVIETNSCIPTAMSVTSPYDPNFRMNSAFHSASLGAIVKLGKEKGYRLIGTNRAGFNVFMMRNDVGQDHFPEITAEQAHNNRFVRAGQAKKWEKRKDYPWQEV